MYTIFKSIWNFCGLIHLVWNMNHRYVLCQFCCLVIFSVEQSGDIIIWSNWFTGKSCEMIIWVWYFKIQLLWFSSPPMLLSSLCFFGFNSWLNSCYNCHIFQQKFMHSALSFNVFIICNWHIILKSFLILSDDIFVLFLDHAMFWHFTWLC